MEVGLVFSSARNHVRGTEQRLEGGNFRLTVTPSYVHIPPHSPSPLTVVGIIFNADRRQHKKHRRMLNTAVCWMHFCPARQRHCTSAQTKAGGSLHYSMSGGREEETLYHTLFNLQRRQMKHNVAADIPGLLRRLVAATHALLPI